MAWPFICCISFHLNMAIDWLARASTPPWIAAGVTIVIVTELHWSAKEIAYFFWSNVYSNGKSLR
jgi:hypothetical protein